MAYTPEQELRIRRAAQAQRIGGAEAMFRRKRETEPLDIHQAMADAVSQTFARADIGGTAEGARRAAFAAQNPNSLTGRLFRASSAVQGAVSQSPEQRLGQIGSGQFRGSQIAKQRMRKGLARRLRGA